MPSIQSSRGSSGKYGSCCVNSVKEVLQTKNNSTNNVLTNDDYDGKCFSPRASTDEAAMDAAATKVQKVYKSYRTRRSLADCAVVVEESWCKALEFAALRRSSVSFFDSNRSETAISRWSRARIRAAKVGKGLSEYEKAQKLALKHWLEAIDPRHRYGHNLHIYYGVWFQSKSSQPFFYWLDVGDGKEITLEKCPRTVLNLQCIKYLGPIERKAYEVVVESGKLLYMENGCHVETPEGTKWIFVLSTSRKLYVAEKIKGTFQHSSFLAGGATIAAGRLVTHHGILEGIWPYSGHYCPTEENFKEFINFLGQHHVDLTNVKKYPMDEDVQPSNKILKCSTESESGTSPSLEVLNDPNRVEESLKRTGETRMGMGLSSCKWSTRTSLVLAAHERVPFKLLNLSLYHQGLGPIYFLFLSILVARNYLKYSFFLLV